MPAIKVNLTEDELAGIDAAAGEVPRERWLRRVCADAVANAGVTISGTRSEAHEPRELAVVDGAPRRGRLTLSEELAASPGEPLPPKVPARGGRR